MKDLIEIFYLVRGLVMVSPPQPYRLSGSPMLRYTSISSSYKYAKMRVTVRNGEQESLLKTDKIADA